MEQLVSHGFSLIGHYPGSIRAIAVRHPYIYAACGWDGLRVLNIQDPAAPQLVSHLPYANYLKTVTMYNDILYLADHRPEEYDIDDAEGIEYPDSGVLFVDIQRPNNPKICGHLVVPDFVDDLVLLHDHLLVLGNSYPLPFKGMLYVFSLAQRTQPHLVGQCAITERAQRIHLDDEQAYIAASNGLYCINLSNLREPRMVWHIGDSMSLDAHDVVIDQGYVYVAASFHGLRLFAKRSINTVEHLGRTLLWGGPAQSVAVRGTISYVVDHWYGLWRFDTTQKDKLVETGFFPFSKMGDKQVSLVDDLIIVADAQNGLWILNNDSVGSVDINLKRTSAYIPEYWGGLSADDQVRIAALLAKPRMDYPLSDDEAMVRREETGLPF